MAKKYKAITRIVVGGSNGDRREIEPGDVVTGLSKDQMVELWNAGVLTEVDEEKEQAADERDQKIADLEQQLAEMRAAKVAESVPQGDAPDETEGSSDLPTDVGSDESPAPENPPAE